MVEGRQSPGAVWHEFYHSLVLEEVDLVVQKVLARALWPLLRSWFGDVVRAWDQPLTDLHTFWWSVEGTAITERACNVFLTAQIPL